MGEHISPDLPDDLKTSLDTGEMPPKPAGERPVSDLEKAAERANNWKRYRAGVSADVQSGLGEKVVPAEGKVNKKPFKREIKDEKWMSNIQTDLRRLLDYIAKPNIKVECNFSNFRSRGFMKNFLAFVIDFTQLKDMPTDPETFEAIAAKRGIKPIDLWGAQGVLNLAYAVRRASERETTGVNVIRLRLETGGQSYYSLETEGEYAVQKKALLDEKMKNYERVDNKSGNHPQPLYTEARPVPEAATPDDPEMSKITKDFEGIKIRGEAVEVRITGKLERAGLPTVYKGVIASHTLGAGRNYFEVWRSGKMLQGNARWKGIVAPDPTTFVAKVLEINDYQDKVTEQEHDAWVKGDALPKSDQRYAAAVPVEVERNMAYMRANPKSEDDIDFMRKIGVIRTLDQLREAQAALKNKRQEKFAKKKEQWEKNNPVPEEGLTGQAWADRRAAEEALNDEEDNI